MEAKKKKVIGISMMVPLAILFVYVVFNPQVWISMLLAVLFSGMFFFGLKMVKGEDAGKIGKDLLDKINPDDPPNQG